MRTARRVLLSLGIVAAGAGMVAAAEESGKARTERTNLLVYADASGRPQPIRTTQDWEQRRLAIRQAMERIMGPLPGPEKRVALDPELVEEAEAGEFVRRLIRYTSEPGSRVPAYLLIPKAVLKSGQRAPAVLALHQTHPAGQKVVVGLGASPNDEYGVELVRRGFVVLAPPYARLAEYWPDLPALGYASGTMKSIWDNVRALDYLATLPFVRANGFGVIGHSLGGHNGVFTAVFDQRILAVVSSCGLDSFVDYYGGDLALWQPGKGWCQDRYMPRLASYAGRLNQVPFDFPELIGALAPRRCFLNAPQGDTNFRWQSVDAVVAAARPIYELYGQSGRLQVEHPDTGHLFPKAQREQAYRVLEEALR
jgi:dienelactone hydrolase